MRYLSQRYTMPHKEVGGLLADIGTGRLIHLEVTHAITYQLTKNLTPEQAKIVGSDTYHIDHATALWLTAAVGVSSNTCEFQPESDAITDPHEDLAVERKARITYGSLIQIIKNPEVREPLKFLHAREVIHFQHFGEALEKIKSKLDEKNFYHFNPEFNKQFVRNEK